jgi:hypothetical protein
MAVLTSLYEFVPEESTSSVATAVTRRNTTDGEEDQTSESESPKPLQGILIQNDKEESETNVKHLSQGITVNLQHMKEGKLNSKRRKRKVPKKKQTGGKMKKLLKDDNV